MDLTLTDEHAQMQETARDFFESNDVLDLARRQMDGEDVVDDLWADLADVEYTTITVPVEYGGLGEGPLYLTLFLEEAGRVVMPGPFPETMAFAVPLIRELGTEAQKETYLEPIASGDLRTSAALYESGGFLPDDVAMDAEPVADGYRLEGTKTLVPYAESVDKLVVATRTRDGPGFHGITLFVVDAPPAAAVEARRLANLDRTRPLYEVEFDGLVVPESARLGSRHGGGSALSAALDEYRTAICGMMVGAADRAVDLSVEHGSSRTQFGEPVGRFQAVKHRIVDMWMDAELARSLAYDAAWALENDDPDASRAVSRLKSHCADTLPELFGDDIQNHGGMGYTWEHDAHVYLKRAKAWETYLGSARQHRERLADSY